MRFTSIPILVLLTLAFCTTAEAQLGGGRRQGAGGQGDAFATRIFSQNDKNNDGKLTGDEIPERMKQNLQRLDANNDSAIQKSELENMFRGRGGGMGGGRAGGMRGRMGGQGKKKDTTVAEVGEKAVEVEIVSPEKVYDAYLYWHHADEMLLDSVNYSILADAEGKVVHRWDTNLTGGGHTSYLLETGGILRIGKRDGSNIGPVASADTMQITDRTGKAVWQLNAEDLDIKGNKILFHHDMQMRPNGNILALIYEQLSAAEAAAAGWTPEDATSFWSDGVMEIKPNLEDGSHEVVWQWRFIDHIVQDKDREAPNYGVVAAHPRRIDANFPANYNPSSAARQHLNSIDYNAELDQILISSFIYDEVWMIDRGITAKEASGRAGDLLFRYGNPAAYDKGTAEDRLFARQHDASWIKSGFPGAGNLLVFNNNNRNSFSMNFFGNSNGSNRPGGFNRSGRGDRGGAGRIAGRGGAMAERAMRGASNVHEFRPVIGKDGKYAIGSDGRFEIKQVWSWEEKGFFASTQGSAKRLLNGNTLLANTGKQYVIEVTPEGKTVARYKGTAPVFKAFKYTKEQIGDLIDSSKDRQDKEKDD